MRLHGVAAIMAEFNTGSNDVTDPLLLRSLLVHMQRSPMHCRLSDGRAVIDKVGNIPETLPTSGVASSPCVRSSG